MSQQVKFLAGFKSDLLSKYGEGTLTPGALYFCTDEKKIYRATANNAYAAVNEEVFAADDLPEVSSAFLGKLYLRQSDMTLHVLNKDKTAFKQLSAPADALVPNDVSEDLNAEDSKLLASKAAVKAGIKVVADKLDTEIANRATAEAQLLKDAKAYADQKDTELKGDYNTATSDQPSNATGLRGEIESRIKTEKDRAESAESGLAGRLNTIEGTGDGSIKAAVKAEADRAKAAEKVNADAIAAEKTRAEKAELALDERIDALVGDGEGSIADQVGEVQNALDDLKNNVIGSPAVEGDPGTPATGLFGKIDEEKARAEAAEKANAAAIKAEETRATTKEEANAKAIADEQTRAEAAEKANADAITVLNGADTVEGSVKKQIKDAVDAEKTLRENKDNELQSAINNINDALGLGGATGGTPISDRLDTVEGKVNDLETIVGHEAIPGGEGKDPQPAEGLVKDVADLKAKDVELAAKDASLQASIDTLNGGAEVAGSVAKAVADEATLRAAEDKKLDDRLKVVEGSIGKDGALESRVAANEEKLGIIQGEGEGSIKKAVADLVGGAPAAMDTLKELADAISTHQGVYDAYVQTVSTELGKKVDKVEGSRLVAETEVTKWNAKAEVSDVTNALTEAKSYTDEEVKKVSDKIGDISALKTGANNSAVSAINELKDNIDAINNVNTGILKQAKNYTDEKVGNLDGLNTTAKNSAVSAINELKSDIDDINGALGLGGATGSVGDRLSNLETAVGAPAGTDPVTEATGLYKKVDDLKAADTALDGRLDNLKSVVGNAESGLVKKVNDNATNISNNTNAIDAINNEATGILAQAKADATTKANTAQTNAEAEAARLDGLLKTEIEKDDGVLMTAIKTAKAAADAAQSDVDAIEKRLDDKGGLVDRLEAVETSIGDGGALEARVAAVEDKAEKNRVAIGDASSGLTKGVADNAAAITAINDENIGILAQAKADATTKANAAKDAAIAKAEELDTALETSLHNYADQAETDAIASAKTYVNEQIGTASVPDGAAASGLHAVIEAGDKAAKAYTDEALTWGSF